MSVVFLFFLVPNQLVRATQKPNLFANNFTSKNFLISQITPDNTLGEENSVVTPDAEVKGLPSELISGGAQREANLFHSFTEFNVERGQQVYFANPTGIENILTRVTGGNLSRIFGTLGVDGAANLFLLNPNGIIFGDNARLDVNGSFLASTAESALFENGVEFSAKNPQAPPLLTVKMPIGLQFGNSPEGIVNRSKADDSTGRFLAGLEVKSEKNISLVGGNVDLEGGNLTAPSGNINIGGLSTAGTIGINANASLSFPNDVARSDISFSNRAFVNVTSDEGGGNITVNAKILNISGNSALIGGTFVTGKSNLQSGNIILDAADSIAIDSARIDNSVNSGNSGDIAIATGSLSLTNSSNIANSTFGTGNAGDIAIATGSLSVASGSNITNSTFGTGDAGNITINARDNVSLDAGNIFSNIEPRAVGNGGQIRIDSGSVSIKGGQIQTISRGNTENLIVGKGNAGNIVINTRDAVIIGDKPIGNKIFTLLTSDLAKGASGKAGNIEINAGSFSFADSGQISSRTIGNGDAGSVTIKTRDNFSIANPFSEIVSTVDTGAVGNGGKIEIDAKNVSILDGAQIRTNVNQASDNLAAGKGNAGNITIEARDTVTIDGIDSLLSSSLETGAKGKAGDLTINSGQLNLNNGAKIEANTSGDGNSGNVNLKVRNLFLLRNNSNVSTTAGTELSSGDGGNIKIDAGLLVGLENSDITANAFQGKGGAIQIAADGIFGLEVRQQLTPFNDITAFSQQNPELDGVVKIITPDFNPNSGLIELPVQPTEARVVQACTPSTNQTQSEFVVTGRGGLPSTSKQILNPDTGWEDWRDIKENELANSQPISSSVTSGNSVHHAEQKIVEAQGWKRSSKGKIILTAQPNTASIGQPWQPPNRCQASQPKK